MTNMNKADLLTDADATFPDQSVQWITPAMIRGFIGNVTDSMPNFTDMASKANSSTVTSLASRVTALEGITPTASSLDARVGSLETWRANKAATLTSIANMSALATVDVLGINLIVGAGGATITAKINELVAGHNDIKAKLTAREITL